MGNDVVETYRKIMGLQKDFLLTPDMVEKHRVLETDLVRKILITDKPSRYEVVKESYDRLFKELPWLTHNCDISQRKRSLFWALFRYSKLVGRDKKVLEIGCGRGDLIWALAQLGNKCVGSDISEERLWSILKKGNPSIEWRVMDGVKVNLPENEFDTVISSNVIEHFHPNDLPEHLKNVRRLLKNGGIYAFDTPNRLTGPHDIRSIFGEENVLGMHLKEYTHGELIEELEKAGFKKIRSRLLPFPLPFLEAVNLQPATIKSLSERLVLSAKPKPIVRFLSRILNIDVIFIVAHK